MQGSPAPLEQQQVPGQEQRARANRILGMVLSREGHPGAPAAGARLGAAGWSSGEEAPGVIQELAPQHFLTLQAEKCWHRLGEQPGLCEQAQELERRFLVATFDVWEKKMCVCLINIGTQQELIS